MIMIAIQMKDAIKTQTYAKSNVNTKMIAKETNRLVTQTQAFVKMVRFTFNEYSIYLFFIIDFPECHGNSQCRPGEICDKTTKTCRKPCVENKDCDGFKQTCDTIIGFCVNG